MHPTMGILKAATVVCVALLATYGQATMKRRYTEEREGTTYQVIEDRASKSKISYVKNSGVCETTKGVNQYSGYVTVGFNQNMWFWLFESRGNPKKDPLVAWLGGGPGCTALLDVLNTNGPCHFTEGGFLPTLNKNSWNNVANMLYIDQPIGVGMSYGFSTTRSTAAAAPLVWNLLQVLYDTFSQYESHDLSIFTTDFGGHYATEFSEHIIKQNALVARGRIKGHRIKLVALGIGNGWFDNLLVERSKIDYALHNKYIKLLNASDAVKLRHTFDTVCVPADKKCASQGTQEACRHAISACDMTSAITALAPPFYDIDIRAANDSDPREPTWMWRDFINRGSTTTAIGAKDLLYNICIETGFNTTGDQARSEMARLGGLVKSGLQVLLWAGDADFSCNYQGVLQSANAIPWPGQKAFASQPLRPFRLGGEEKGLFKSKDNLSFLQVYDAGRLLALHQPELALHVFTRTIRKLPVA